MEKTLSWVLLAVALILGVVGLNPAQTPSDNQENPVGAVSSPDIPSRYINWGGVRTWNAGTALNTSNHILCALQSPASTSTLQFAAVRAETGTTTALTHIYIAKAATATATTTALSDGTYAVAANNQFTVVASSTLANAENLIFAPNTYLVVNARGGAGVTFPQYSMTGNCSAQWVELNTK